jgi:Leucine Rich repeat
MGKDKHCYYNHHSSSSSDSVINNHNKDDNNDSSGEDETDQRTITTVASTVSPSSPAGGGRKINSNTQVLVHYDPHSMMTMHHHDDNNYNNNEEEDNNHNNDAENDNADPFTEANVEYDITRAFLRLYQRDPTLRCIDLYDITEENAISILSIMPQQQQHHDGHHNHTIFLQELCLTYSNLSLTIVPCLNRLGPNLRILDLGGNQLGDEGVEALMNALCSSTTTGDATCSSTTTSGGGGGCGLKFLNLSDNQIGTDGVCAIADANLTLGLQSLCLCQNPHIGHDHSTTLAGEALLQLSDTLEVIFCWDNSYSYAVKDLLQNSAHPKLYWVRPYHWESELQYARDRALRHVPVNAETVRLQLLEDRIVDPEHYVSNRLPQTSTTFRAARQHLLDNFHPGMLDPTLLHRMPRQVVSFSPMTSPNHSSTTNVPRTTKESIEEKRQAEETKAELKIRLRRRREEIANNKVVVADVTSTTSSSSTNNGNVTTVIDGIPVTFLSSRHRTSTTTKMATTTTTTTTTIKAGKYGNSVRRWKPSATDDASAAAAVTDGNGDGHNSNCHQQHQQQPPPIPDNFIQVRAANRRLNLRRQKLIQGKLATVQRDTQYATAKAKLEILERHRELAHQYI